MKTKEKKTKKPPKERRTQRTQKKLHFEDGVRAALVAAAVICVAVLGIGGFFAVRSVLSSGSKPEISLLDNVPEISGEIPDFSPELPSSPEVLPETDIPQGTDILPELEQAIRDLEATQQGTTPSVASGAPAPNPAQPQAVPAKPAQFRGMLVLVIDDAGNNLQDLEPFLKFPGPITIAVLPGLPNSVEAAKRVRAAGKELFLHQPMEPLNGQNPGPGTIKTGMTPAQVKEILVRNFNEIGPVAGFNNHEGSRVTMDMAIMRPIMEVSRDSALIFLDSRTIADSVAPQAARQIGITIAERDIFLDNEQDRASILTALEAGCKRAEQNGSAILIGHAWTPRLAALLIEMYPQLVQRGFAFATVSNVTGRGK
ncbi:MAG: divergent polysaccharide deacetylase family protein [Treponema sp.]|nr:divergent polysaccharide deacetylase family protein [Treponema sp.]